jgi:hypothetical protein
MQPDKTKNAVAAIRVSTTKQGTDGDLTENRTPNFSHTSLIS